jgi:hypothetical protein
MRQPGMAFDRKATLLDGVGPRVSIDLTGITLISAGCCCLDLRFDRDGVSLFNLRSFQELNV